MSFKCSTQAKTNFDVLQCSIYYDAMQYEAIYMKIQSCFDYLII